MQTQSTAKTTPKTSGWRKKSLWAIALPVLAFLVFYKPQKSHNISAGEQILIVANATNQKQQGTEAIQKRDFVLAQRQFNQSLAQYPNDPETLIYLNNAKLGDKAKTIAVSVPISSNLNVAQEILRGVAQAQDEINRGDRPLKVLIADDANDPQLVKQIATELTQNTEVLAVVGHNASNATLAAAPIYQKAGLVMISPTSFANQLSGFGDYIFRTIPPTNVLAEILADHVVKTQGNITMVACFDKLSPDNVAYKDAFLSAFRKQGGQVLPMVCDFSAPDFDAAKIMQQMTGVQGILLTPHVDRLSKAFDLAQENHGKIPLYGSPTLYTAKTLQSGKENVLGLVMPTVWHPKQNSDQKFAKQAETLWGGTVNWRTATAYDATMAIAQGLTQDSTRADLKAALRDPIFKSQGAGGLTQFTNSGDRQIMPILVQVNASSGGYTFAPFEAKVPALTKPKEPQAAIVPETQP